MKNNKSVSPTSFTHEQSLKMFEAIKLYKEGIDHFYKCINFKQSALDAGAITFMNESGIKMNDAFCLATTQPNKEELYYIQDRRSFLGNAVIWWGWNNNGYTPDIESAGKYTKEEAMKICKNRPSEVAWPVDYINSNTKARTMIVDMQYLDKDKRRRWNNKKIR